VNRTSEFRCSAAEHGEIGGNGRIGNWRRLKSIPSIPSRPVQPTCCAKELDYECGWDMRKFHTENACICLSTSQRPNWMRVDNYAQGMITNWGAHYLIWFNGPMTASIRGPWK